MPYSRGVRLKNKLLSAWKWCLSFSKRNWELSDYPIALAEIEPDPDYKPPRFNLHRYRAFIVNSAILGSGDTPEEARVQLEQHFEMYRSARREQGVALFRPGTQAPIEFVSNDKIVVNEELSEDFIHRVLALEWAWISDESSLWDFHTEQSNDLLYSKILEIYGVDVSDIQSARIWEILERIASRQSHSQ